MQTLAEINNSTINISTLLRNINNKKFSKDEISKGLKFTYNLFIENFIIPNKLKMPLSRKILQKYFVNNSI